MLTSPQSEPPRRARAFGRPSQGKTLAGGTVTFPEFGSIEPNSGVNDVGAALASGASLMYRSRLTRGLAPWGYEKESPRALVWGKERA